MPPTTSYSFGDIVLVPFPFTDQSATKRRPAVVISSATYHQQRADLVIMAVTSQARSFGAWGEVAISDWKNAGLLKASVVKPVITTIDGSLVIRRLGRLGAETKRDLREAIDKLVG